MTNPDTSNVDAAALSKALQAARQQLDAALSHVGGDLAADRLSRLDDQNTSCQNSGCGGAVPETVARQQVQG
jgi:hypothetical protein